MTESSKTNEHVRKVRDKAWKYVGNRGREASRISFEGINIVRGDQTVIQE